MRVPVRRFPFVLGAMALSGGLSACATGPSAPPLPHEAASSPHYVCANGSSFVTQADPAGGMVLWINNGAGHRLSAVPDLNGGTLYQDSAFQLRPAPFGATATLTDRSTLTAQTCSRL